MNKLEKNMKEKTKDNDKVNIKKSKTNFICFENIDEMQEYRRIAKGREFCKRGKRLQDIYVEEIERYNYENEKSIFAKIFKYHNVKKRYKTLQIEDKRASILRKILYTIIRENKEDIDEKKIIKKAKETILDEAREYEKTIK